MVDRDGTDSVSRYPLPRLHTKQSADGRAGAWSQSPCRRRYQLSARISGSRFTVDHLPVIRLLVSTANTKQSVALSISWQQAYLNY